MTILTRRSALIGSLATLFAAPAMSGRSAALRWSSPAARKRHVPCLPARSKRIT